MNVLFLAVLFIGLARAQYYTTDVEKKAILRSSPSEVASFLKRARASNVDNETQKKFLELGLLFLREKMGKDLGLTSEGLKNPAIMKKISQSKWNQVYTEFSLLDNYLRHKQEFTRCEDHYTRRGAQDKGLPISLSVLDNVANTCPEDEGASLQTTRVYQASDNKFYTVPSFGLSANVGDLLKVDRYASIANMFPESAKENDPGYPMNPTMDQFKAKFPGKSDEELYTLAIQSKLRSDTYDRILTNSLKTMVMANHLSGLDQDGRGVNEFIQNTLRKICKHCTKEQEKIIGTRALNSYNHDLKTTYKGFETSPEPKMAASFCQQLKEGIPTKSYNVGGIQTPSTLPYHYEVYDPKYLKPQAQAGKDYTANVDRRNVQEMKDRIKANNILIIDKVAKNTPGGMLMLTEALTKLDDKQQPLKINLKCNASSLAEDTALIRKAGLEVQAGIMSYLDKVHQKIDPDQTSEKKLDEDIKFLVATNPASIGQALAGSNQGTTAVCNAIYSLEQDKQLKEFENGMVTYAGWLIGAGLSVSGVGEVPGIVLLANLGALGVSSARMAYNFHERAEDAKIVEILKQTKLMDVKNQYSQQEIDRHLENWHHLKSTLIRQGLFTLVFDIIPVIHLSVEYYGSINFITQRVIAFVKLPFYKFLPGNTKSDIVALKILDKTFNPQSEAEMMIKLQSMSRELIAKKTLNPVEVTIAEKVFNTLTKFDIKTNLSELYLKISTSAPNPLVTELLKTPLK